MRITNVDTLSAYFDRLVTERIKWYFFKKNGLTDKVEHQEAVIKELRAKMSTLYWECLEDGKYDYLNEKRTFKESSIIEELEELIVNDINIGEADRERLAQATSDNPDTESLIRNEKRLRKANEGRARNKNQIDQNFKNEIEK